MSQSEHEQDVSFIQALAQLLRANDLSEIEVRRDMGADKALTVRVARQPAQPLPAPATAQAAPRAAAAAEAPAETPAAPAEDPAEDPGVVASPMVGTVYLQAEPGAAPFVRPGDSVAEGQTLLIIEAMKTMNQIPSPRAGIVRRVLVADESPVEFGQPLVILD